MHQLNGAIMRQKVNVVTKGKRTYGGVALLTAVAASLCCITPVLALVAGLGGVASAFSWLEPFRPYLIGVTVAVLAFAWYQQLKPKAEVDCNCEDDKPSFFQSKSFLGIVTVFAALMLAFPYYSANFYPDQQASITESTDQPIDTVSFNIDGMTCTGCEGHITHAVNELAGVRSVQASYEQGSATVLYDSTLTNKDQITQAINATGYKVIH